MLLVRQPQLRLLVFHKCGHGQSDLSKPITKIFTGKHEVEATLLVPQDLHWQNSLNRILGGLNTVLTPPRRGTPSSTFSIFKIRRKRLAILLRQTGVVPPAHACDAVVNPQFDLLTFKLVHSSPCGHAQTLNTPHTLHLEKARHGRWCLSDLGGDEFV